MSISDHIVLMKDGFLQQHAAPQQLYLQPANQFVADFLGNPPINNIKGQVAQGRFVATGGSSLSDPGLDRVPEGRPVHLSVRAESFTFSPREGEDKLGARVQSVFQMGKEEMAILEYSGQSFRAYLSADLGLAAGDQIFLGLKDRGVFVFDQATGERYL